MKIEEIGWEEFPDDLKDIVTPYLKKWEPLIPTWVQEFIVRFVPDLNSTLQAHINYRNRWFVLKITGNFLDQNEEERHNSIRHELIHLNLEPMASNVSRVIDDLSPQGSEYRSLIDSFYTDGMEAAIEDLSRGLGRLMESENHHG